MYLDGGPCPGDVPSTIVDLTGTVPRLLRQGVIPADRLREVILLNDVEEAGPGDAAGDATAEGAVPDDAGEPDGAVHGDAGEPDGAGEATPGAPTTGQEDAPDQGEHSRGPAAG